MGTYGFQPFPFGETNPFFACLPSRSLSESSIERVQDGCINTSINTTDLLDGFERVLRIDLNQAERTVQGHLYLIRHFLEAIDKDPRQVSTEEIRTYLSGFQEKSASTRANLLKSLKRFYCDFLKMPQVVESFKFPKRTYTPRTVPSKDDLNYPELKLRGFVSFRRCTRRGISVWIVGRRRGPRLSSVSSGYAPGSI